MYTVHCTVPIVWRTWMDPEVSVHILIFKKVILRLHGQPLSIWLILYRTRCICIANSYCRWTYSTVRCAKGIHCNRNSDGSNQGVNYSRGRWDIFGLKEILSLSWDEYCIAQRTLQPCHCAGMAKIQRRRIKTEEKAKVVAAVWGQNLVNSLLR